MTDILGEKGFITVGQNSLHSTEDDLHEETSLLSLSQLIIEPPTLTVDTEYVPDAPEITEHQLDSLRSHRPDDAENSNHLKRVFISEESRVADAALPHQTQEANGYFPQRDVENRQVDFSQMPHQKETAVKCCFREFMAVIDSQCVHQMTCEAEYMVNDSFLGKTDVETVSRQTDCYLICETDYIANICLTANTAEEDRAISFSTAC